MTGLEPDGFRQWLGEETESDETPEFSDTNDPLAGPATTDTPILDREVGPEGSRRWHSVGSAVGVAPPDDADDDDAWDDSDQSADSPPARRRRRMPLLVLVGAVIAMVIVAVGLGLVMGGSEKSPPPSRAQSQPPAPAAPPAAGADCPSSSSGATVSGRDPGDTTTGPGVIKAFDFGYYVLRSGAAARAVVAPSAKVTSAEQIQSGIDKLDPQTLHCLSIVDRGAGLYAVAVTEIPPRGEQPSTWHQLIQTTTDKDHAWIVSIQKDPAAS